MLSWFIATGKLEGLWDGCWWGGRCRERCGLGMALATAWSQRRC